MNINPYKGKGEFDTYSKFAKFIINLIFSIFALFISMIAVLDFFYGNDKYKAYNILVIVFLIVLIIFLRRLLYRKIFINEYDVKLVNKGKNIKTSFAWNEIKVIGIGVYPFGTGPTNGFLYLTTRNITEDLAFNKMFEAPDVIVVKYKPKLVHCILNYWDGEIRNLETEKSWFRYINKL